MKQTPKRFDMVKKPQATAWYLRPLVNILSFPDVWAHQNRLTKVGMKGVKPPYLLLCNHNAFMDFKVATKAIFPHRANYVVAIDGFIGREGLLRKLGCVCKRKFTSDVVLIKHLLRVARRGDILILYPEARYSLCGTTAVLPEGLGALCKRMRVPVVTLICHGHHVNSPFWNLHDRGIKPTEAEMTLQYTPEELKTATEDEINAKLVKAFQYDDFAWQKERGIRTTYPKRAEGLHKVLYQCPHCQEEYRMASENDLLFCRACGKKWRLTELNQLEAVDGETEFSAVPAWYEWERENVRREVETGTYSTGKMPVTVDSLPNAKRFIRLGEGTMIHDMTGFHVEGTDFDGDPFRMDKPVPSLYSCHIEYDYLGKHGDCVDLNTLEDTWYIYPHDCDFAVTKMALATEELFRWDKLKSGKEIKEGIL